MKQDSILIEATRKEVINIGWNRYFRKNWLGLLIPLVVAVVVFLAASAVMPEVWAWWLKVSVYLPLFTLFLWTYYRLWKVPQKAGKELLRQLLEEDATKS